jgi:hypothetical protein
MQNSNGLMRQVKNDDAALLPTDVARRQCMPPKCTIKPFCRLKHETSQVMTQVMTLSGRAEKSNFFS